MLVHDWNYVNLLFWVGALNGFLLAFLQSSSRSSHHHGARYHSGGWGSRRSSWNNLARGHSLKHKPFSAEHESLLSGEQQRITEAERERPVIHHHRRTFSLDTKDSSDLELAPAVSSGHKPSWKIGVTLGPSKHQDCNGKMPTIAKDIFPEMNNRKEHGEDDEEIDYVNIHPFIHSFKCIDYTPYHKVTGWFTILKR